MEVTINVKDIRSGYGLPMVIGVDISFHSYNQEKLWEETRGLSWTSFDKMLGNKNLLKLDFEKMSNIICKYMESRVGDMDDFTVDKMVVLSAIMKNFKIH